MSTQWEGGRGKNKTKKQNKKKPTKKVLDLAQGNMRKVGVVFVHPVDARHELAHIVQRHLAGNDLGLVEVLLRGIEFAGTSEMVYRRLISE